MKKKVYKGYKKKRYDPIFRTYKNIIFDSKLEMRYYQHLKSIGAQFIYHPKSFIYMDFDCDLTNKHIKHSYTPDFIVIYNNKFIITDTKGGFSPSEGKIRRDAILMALNKDQEYVKYLKSVITEKVYHNKIEDNTLFKEITEDRDGNGIELNTYLQQKRDYKKARRNEVGNLTREFTQLCKQMVKKGKESPCRYLIEFQSYIDKLDNSKAGRVYAIVKNNKLYRKKHKEINQFKKNYKKMLTSKQHSTIDKFHRLCLEQIIEASKAK